MNERDRRIAIVDLFQHGGQPSTAIQKLGLTRNQLKTVYNTYHRFLKTGPIERKKRGSSRASETRKKAIKLIGEKIRRNPARSQRKLARDHNYKNKFYNHKNKLYAVGPQERFR